MKKWSKDLLRGALIGFVTPAVLLTAVVAVSQQPEQTQPSRPGIAVTLPILQTTASQEREKLYLPVQTDTELVQMELETYLVGVLLREVSTDFSMEALKAQAVAARTYALKAHTLGYKHDGAVCTTAACCQGYLSPEAYLSAGGDASGLDRVRSAVEETAGLVLCYEEELILATYFDCSGGYTEDAAAVWGKIYPYLRAVESPGEEIAPYYRDTVIFSLDAFREALGEDLPGQPETWFDQVTYTPGGGVETMIIGGHTFSGTQLRSLLGLRSTVFSVSVTTDGIAISTQGYGHRVGLSQYGAEAMARNGQDFVQILAHYYLGSEIVNYALLWK